jgi:TRAP-type C4-dicarboxylate transport system substrate-binding protein
VDPLVIKFGGYQKPASIHNRAAGRFGAALGERLGSRVRFELIGNVLDLGRPSGDLPLMVERGELSLCYISSVRFTHPVPEFKLLELPFIVKNRAAAQRAFAGELGALYKRRMRASTPFRLLGIWDNGFRHVTNKVRPIRSPADCRGLRIRTQMSELHGEALAALGFIPIPADVKQLVEQIAGDTFDAQENPLTNTWNFGVHNFHRHLTLTGHLFGATAMICNEQHFQSWPADVRAAVEAAAREATAFQLELAAAEDDEILRQIDARKNDIVHLSAAQHAAFVAAVQPVLAKYRKELDARLFSYFD